MTIISKVFFSANEVQIHFILILFIAKSVPIYYVTGQTQSMGIIFQINP
jgi:hypothetical protein